jgi:methylmalonyl-CoA/ethylmalonyl-CoA epimerase
MKIRKIDHICFVVRDLEKAKETYGKDLGLVPDAEYVAPEESIKMARYYAGEVAIELMEPTTPDSEVGRFLKHKGEGFFLISYKVDNVHDVLKELKDKEVQLIDEKPRHLFGNSYAFIHHPAQLFSTLTEVLDGEFNINAKP